MRAVLLAAAASLAAAAVHSAPAAAQNFAADQGFAGSSGHGSGVSAPDGFSAWRDDRRGGRRSTVIVGGVGWSDGWALHNNRTFEPDAYNDWWHERPWRSYPRWVQQAPPVNCDRMWWGGGAWRCSW